MKQLTKIFALAACIILVLGCMPLGAITPYSTYTYSIDGFALMSPDAYVPDRQVDSAYMGLETAIDDPRDMVVDGNKNIYIADAANNRIVVLDRYYKLKFTIAEFINQNGVPDALKSPSGVFVTEEKIYVADTDNNRIVMFELDGTFYKVIEEPDADVFPAGSIYKPVAIAVDAYGRIYVVSSTTYMGVIAINEDGVFQGFIGAQKVTIDPLQIIWRRFQTAEQRALSQQYVSTEFNNITIDENGFIYVTTSSIAENSQQAAITNKESTYAPVKKLNTAGSDIMKRNGFFGPGGEVNVTNLSTAQITGASKIIDAAIGPENTWSIIDEKRSKIYTYDEDGNLLFIFGDQGQQLGNIQSVEAIVYLDNDILVLDKTADNITVFRRTEYGDLLIDAIRNTNERNYDTTINYWTEILKRNNNFDTAYIGIGKSLYRSAEYEESLDYYKSAYDTENYSESFKEIRKNWISKYIILIPIFVIVVVVALVLFNKYAAKLNKKTQLKKGRKTFWEELIYANHLILHPFDGFWDLKHEQRGSMRASFVWLALAILTFFYQDVGTGYIFDARQTSSTIFVQITAVLVPVILWSVANWCLTTLFDGEGSLKDIFIATCYSLVPLPILIIPSVLISNVALASEATIINLLVTFAFVWAGLLIFFGMMVTHDYTFSKNVLTSIGTIIGMAIIMFIGILFSTLLAKIVSFISSIITEITFRM
ncbi:MAG: YIP1 family protein [Clostridia bacterium]|nr:YIP1 family protein [Clostridia bacterium]